MSNRALRKVFRRLEEASSLRFGVLPEVDTPGITKLAGYASSADWRWSGGKSSVSDSKVYDGQFSKPNRESSGQDDTGQSLALRVQVKKAKRKDKLLACPNQKNNDVHVSPRSCRYEGGSFMSDIIKHLKSRGHRDDVPFVELCRTCWDYITDKRDWQHIHKVKQCGEGMAVTHRQKRGTRIEQQWQDLYTKLYPDSEKIPCPCKSQSSSYAMSLRS